MALATRIGGLISLNLLLPIAIFIFATGFFPYKPFIPGLATYQSTPLEDHAPHAPFSKLVFMVVDALRSDFVFGHGSGFDFTQSLIRDGPAIPFTAHATAPTVTMPRVKAITTGSIPSFLDMILNFAESDKSSSLAHQDTWLAQMKSKKDSNLIMYGDDTWLKLFPDTFGRSDGTSSFFVSDFTEVDTNVTRHVPDELGSQDWNVMIMHYLGMDHIGHKSGSKSINMLPKQREMDGIVQQIYQAIEQKQHLHDTLLVLCGDHGMTDSGNHGGSAPGETSPALVFMSPKLKQRHAESTHDCPTVPHQDLEFYDLVEQSDIAPTLAGLLGFPVPLNNLGVFIPDFLNLWPNGHDREQLLLRNAMQMLYIAQATFPHDGYDDSAVPVACSGTTSTAEELVCGWREVMRVVDSRSTTGSEGAVVEASYKFCRLAQRSLSSTASNYNLTRMYVGLVLALAILVISSTLSWPLLQIKSSSTGRFFSGAAVAYFAMMLASSYVEEEHQFWFWVTSSWLMIQLMSSAQRGNKLGLVASGMMLLLFRILRRWNHSGQKFQGADDIARFISRHALPLLWPLVLLTFQTLFNDLVSITFAYTQLAKTTARFYSAFLVINLLLFKLAFTLQQTPELLGSLPTYIPWLASLDPTSLARLQFFSLGLATLYISTKPKTSLQGNPPPPPQQQLEASKPLTSPRKEALSAPPSKAAALTTLLTTLLLQQSTLANIPAYLLLLALSFFLRRLEASLPHQTTTSSTLSRLLLSRASFHALGGTNGISSIDLSSAYNGVTAYSPGAVGFLLVLSNWGGPILWRMGAGNLVMGFGGEMSEERPGKGGEQMLEGRRDLGSRRSRGFPGISREMKTRMRRTEIEGAEVHNPTHATSTHPNTLTPAEVWQRVTTLLTTWLALETTAVLTACTLHRQHLFVWTVFSPKFLYMAAWVVVWHLGCGVVCAGGLVLLG